MRSSLRFALLASLGLLASCSSESVADQIIPQAENRPDFPTAGQWLLTTVGDDQGCDFGLNGQTVRFREDSPPNRDFVSHSVLAGFLNTDPLGQGGPATLAAGGIAIGDPQAEPRDAVFGISGLYYVPALDVTVEIVASSSDSNTFSATAFNQTHRVTVFAGFQIIQGEDVFGDVEPVVAAAAQQLCTVILRIQGTRTSGLAAPVVEPLQVFQGTWGPEGEDADLAIGLTVDRTAASVDVSLSAPLPNPLTGGFQTVDVNLADFVLESGDLFRGTRTLPGGFEATVEGGLDADAALGTVRLSGPDGEVFGEGPFRVALLAQ